jgi:OOP family OmpA-OmpF porin
MTTLSADELFAFDKAELTDKAKSQLDKIAQDLNRDPRAPVVPIVGHTDRLGSDAYNLKLSQARADAVKNYLASKGVAAGRLQATGKGEADPVVQCTDKNHDALVRCLAPNRRVVIGPVTVPAN